MAIALRGRVCSACVKDNGLAHSDPIDQLDAAACVARLREAHDPAVQVELAEAGLRAPGASDDLRLLLLRHLYRGQLSQGALAEALSAAEALTSLAVELGQFREVAHHDCARVLAALGRLPEAITEQRMAVHTAVPSRQSFQWWSLATLEHFSGLPDEALTSLSKGLHVAQQDRVLLQAHATYIRVERGQATDGFAEFLETLRRQESIRYLSYLRGMIAYHIGHTSAARTDLGAWVGRHREADMAQRITLAEELRRAQRALDALSQRGLTSTDE